ncbi:MAG: hypothetical protein KDK55_07260, partial [Chlamydiia bacterium]|nr:hypothetical protein [Chlamydiia bacterium]
INQINSRKTAALVSSKNKSNAHDLKNQTDENNDASPLNAQQQENIDENNDASPLNAQHQENIDENNDASESNKKIVGNLIFHRKLENKSTNFPESCVAQNLTVCWPGKRFSAPIFFTPIKLRLSKKLYLHYKKLHSMQINTQRHVQFFANKINQINSRKTAALVSSKNKSNAHDLK